MKKQTLEQKRESLINNLIYLAALKETLWGYHPNNPKKIDVVASYDNLESEIVGIENKLDKLEE
tara:strand:- start:43 stop:234 length:192 start_codon:yes stop_codon:yes gene_type:complete